MKYVEKLILCYKNAFIDTIKHDGIEHAGYISFLCMLSIFPFFIFFTAIIAGISSVYLENNLNESLIGIFTSLLTHTQFAKFIIALQPRIIEITASPPQSFLGLAIISVIWTASSLLEGLRTILNRAYRVSKLPSYFFRRIMSILQFILITCIMLAITILIKFAPLISNYMISLIEIFRIEISQYEYIKNILSIVIIVDRNISDFVSFMIMFLFLSYIYYLIPNKKQKFAHTFIGTFNTIILWWVSTNAFQYYIVVFPQINLVYGSIAGIIIALLYFYICSIIFIYGAELNYWSYILYFKKNKKKLDVKHSIT